MEEKPSLRDVFGVFVFYFLAQFIIAPSVMQLVHRLLTGEWNGGIDWILSEAVRPWWNFTMILVVAFMVVFYLFYIEKQAINAVWGKFRIPFKTCVRILGYWLIAYPVVLLVNHGVNTLMEKWVSFPVTDQVAVGQVKAAYSHPILYFLTSAAIVTLVPLVEEIIFRGFFQQWLKRYFSVFTSVLIAAFVFALFHYSTEQGWMNVELIAALFTFSLFLGMVRERYQSLNASILLHGVFNGMSVLFLTIQENLK